MTQIKLLFVLEMFKETNCLVKPYCDPTSSNKALLFNFCLGNKNTRNCTRICTDAFGWSYCHVYFQSVNFVSMSGDLLPLNDLELHPPILHVEKPTPLHRCFEPTLQSIRPFNEVVKDREGIKAKKSHLGHRSLSTKSGWWINPIKTWHKSQLVDGFFPKQL